MIGKTIQITDRFTASGQMKMSFVEVPGILPEINILSFRIFYARLSPDADTDGDGVLDIDDNCPWTSNPGQEDTNQNSNT